MRKLILFFIFFSMHNLFINSCSNNKNFVIIDRKCGGCHSPNIVYMEKRSDRQWDRIIYAMKLRGLKLSEREEREIKRILYKHF